MSLLKWSLDDKGHEKKAFCCLGYQDLLLCPNLLQVTLLSNPGLIPLNQWCKFPQFETFLKPEARARYFKVFALTFHKELTESAVFETYLYLN